MTRSIKRYLYILMLALLPAVPSLAMLSPTLGQEEQCENPNEEDFELQICMLLKHWAQATGLPSDVVYEISKRVRALFIKDARQAGDYVFEREIPLGSGVRDLRFSLDSSFIVANGRVLRAQDGVIKHCFLGKKHCFSSDGKLIASSGDDDIKLSIWNLKEETLIETFQVNEYISDFVFSHDDSFIVIMSHTQFFVGKLKPASLAKLGDCEIVYSLAISPDDTLFAFGAKDGGLQLWDVASLTRRSVFSVGNYLYRSALAFSPDGNELWLMQPLSISTWDIEKNQMTREINLNSLDQGGFNFKRGLAFSSECRLMARSCYNLFDENSALIEIYNEASGQKLNTLKKEGLEAVGLVLSPDGHRLVVMINLQGFQIWVLRPLLAKTTIKQGV